MKSAIKRFSAKTSKSPVPIAGSNRYMRGHSMDLGVGKGDRQT